MTNPHGDKEQPGRDMPSSIDEHDPRGEAMDEEEKILAGHDDVNMPALLTRDVQGG